jgi:hypothetical protein
VRANTIRVTTTVQGDSRGLGPNGTNLCSLAEAIYAANTRTNRALGTTVTLYTSRCETGSGHDTIVLTNAAYSVPAFVHAIQHSRYGPTATPVIFSNITIQGNGATIQRASGSPNMRAFTVGFDQLGLAGGAISGWGSLTLQSVTIQGFTVKGGDGSYGAGGGLGAGAAVYVDGSDSSSLGLTVVDSTFQGNGAVGGNCRSPAAGGGGGGGGTDISANQATGADGGIIGVNDGSATSFTLQNTIVANNGANECFLLGSVTTSSGAGSLIVNNGSGSSVSPCPNVVSIMDPGSAPNYTVAVTGLPAGLVTSTPAASPAFTWAGTGMMSGHFVLN